MLGNLTRSGLGRQGMAMGAFGQAARGPSLPTRSQMAAIAPKAVDLSPTGLANPGTPKALDKVFGTLQGTQALMQQTEAAIRFSHQPANTHPASDRTSLIRALAGAAIGAAIPVPGLGAPLAAMLAFKDAAGVLSAAFGAQEDTRSPRRLEFLNTPSDSRLSRARRLQGQQLRDQIHFDDEFAGAGYKRKTPGSQSAVLRTPVTMGDARIAQQSLRGVKPKFSPHKAKDIQARLAARQHEDLRTLAIAHHGGQDVSVPEAYGLSGTNHFVGKRAHKPKVTPAPRRSVTRFALAMAA